jgi:glycosyltransferase involved in cell wall biosynthesis
MNSHKVMLIPLFSGSGIRVKIIEGLALGKCIITTSIGADGISVKHRENILIADTTKEFAEQMKFCMDQPKRVAEIGESARRFAKANFSKSAVKEELKALF